VDYAATMAIPILFLNPCLLLTICWPQSKNFAS